MTNRKKTPKKGEYWTKDTRKAKKNLKRLIKKSGINIPNHKKAMRSLGNKTANWL